MKNAIFLLCVLLGQFFAEKANAVTIECSVGMMHGGLILDYNVGECRRATIHNVKREPILYYRYWAAGPFLEADIHSDAVIFCPGSRVEQLYGKTFYGAKAGLSFFLGLSGAGFINSEARTCAILKGHLITVGGGVSAGTLKFYKTYDELMKNSRISWGKN